jgi:hypothetical protein
MARITERLDLDNLTITVPLILIACELEGGMSAKDASLFLLDLSGSTLTGPDSVPEFRSALTADWPGAEAPASPPPAPALSAQGLSARTVILNDINATGHSMQGTIALTGANLGLLSCAGATIYNDKGPALEAAFLRTERNVSLHRKFTAEGSGDRGAVILHSAQIGGQLGVIDASLVNATGPALLTTRMRVSTDMILTSELLGAGTVALDMTDTIVGGRLHFQPSALKHRIDPSRRICLDGLRYEGLPIGTDVTGWLDLIRYGTNIYAPQPYQNLAARCQMAGHDDDARRVLMAQRKDQVDRHALAGRGGRLWARLIGVTVGYGYQPWRALVGLVALTALAIVVAFILGAHGALRGPGHIGDCSTEATVAVGINMGLPLIKVSPGSACTITDTATGQALTAISWSLQSLSWGLATLFAAGFTGVIRKPR